MTRQQQEVLAQLLAAEGWTCVPPRGRDVSLTETARAWLERTPLSVRAWNACLLRIGAMEKAAGRPALLSEFAAVVRSGEIRKGRGVGEKTATEILRALPDA